MSAIHSCFFYGTLLHPAVIKRVIGNDGAHLKICPAILLDHTRHHVKNADYPGIVPYKESKQFFDRELTRDELCVRGSLVSGLTRADINRLDYFEGDMYERQHVQVHPLAPLVALLSDETHYNQLLVPGPLPEQLTTAVPAETYIWIAGTRALEPSLWDYATFVKEKLSRWVGQSADNRAYEEEFNDEVATSDKPTEADIVSQRLAGNYEHE